MSKRMTNPFGYLQQLLSLRELHKAMRLDEFDEKAYLARHPDVAAAIGAGHLKSGREHYMQHGYAENRAMGGEAPRRAIPSLKSLWRAWRRSDYEKRNTILAELGGRANSENLYIIASELEAGRANQIHLWNKRFLESAKRKFQVETFNYGSKEIHQSLIICLYGHPQFLSLQIALFANSCRFGHVEFIFINNSPEHSDLLIREAKQASGLYEVPVTLINASTNLGFAAANNLAAGHAKSSRLLFVNPDVFPKDQNWLEKHNKFAAIEGGRMFGARLYYDDGSVMHAGMYFVRDRIRNGLLKPIDLLRVEHYAKGFPDYAPEAIETRVVPAVTAAFLSIDRSHFEHLQGFDEDYVLGHYEDADLCLRSAAAGQPVWFCGDVQLWHMEGKGSVRKPELDGATQVNRWLFTRKWLSSAVDGPEGNAVR
jgi:GT2 family glycosyltransferase